MVRTSPRLQKDVNLSEDAELRRLEGSLPMATVPAGGDQPEPEAVGGITGDVEEEELATHGGFRWWGAVRIQN